MAHLRATKKVLSRLPAPTTPDETPVENALGDWFVNRVVIARQPLLVLVSSTSLLPIVTPANNVRGLPDRLWKLVFGRLVRLGVPDRLAQAELEAMEPMHVAPTNDRSVVGILTQFCLDLPYVVPEGPWTHEDLMRAESRLGETPCHASRRFEDVVWPNEKAVELIWSRWAPGESRGQDRPADD
jgi:hypothetical protein